MPTGIEQWAFSAAMQILLVEHRPKLEMLNRLVIREAPLAADKARAMQESGVGVRRRVQ